MTAQASPTLRASPAPIPETAVGADASRDRVVGLDSIRFLCALMVVLQHVGLLPESLRGGNLHSLSTSVVEHYNTFVTGPAAVIFFFVISGFCIHLPFSRGRSMRLVPFYSRRLTRIAIPAAVFYALVCAAARAVVSPQTTILWSVICETIYYLLYPLLLAARKRVGWVTLLVSSSLVVAVLLLREAKSLTWGAHAYPALGWLTWIVGLPCWLLGCWLAENQSRFPLGSSALMWGLRLGLYLLAVTLNRVHFYVSSAFASNCVLLDLFALPATALLGMEIRYRRARPPRQLLEWAGAWSYSLYLIHPLVEPLFGACGLGFVAAGASTHFWLVPFALLLSYVFFLAVERPSHRLAIRAGRAGGSATSLGVAG